MWAGDQRQKLFRNLEVLEGAILLSAVTAPGAEALPWDEHLCARLGEHVHSGQLGCRVRGEQAGEWNRSAPDRWRRLHRRAYQEAVRQVGKGSVWLVARVWETQARGVLHIHPVLAYGTALQMTGARAYLARLAELAPQYGFGFVHHSPKHVRPQPAENAAAYPVVVLREGQARQGDAVGVGALAVDAPFDRARLYAVDDEDGMHDARLAAQASDFLRVASDAPL